MPMKTDICKYTIKLEKQLRWRESKEGTKYLDTVYLKDKPTMKGTIIKSTEEDFNNQLHLKLKEYPEYYITRISKEYPNGTYETEFDLIGIHPIIGSDLAQKYYKKYQEMFFIDTKKLKELLKENILVFNRHGIYIKIYPLNRDKKHLITINEIPFEELDKDSKESNIWNDIKKENESEILDWRWLQNLDYPEVSKEGFNMIGRYFKKSIPINKILNLVRLTFNNNIDFRWFKGDTPDKIQDRVDQYCYLKNLAAEAEILWPIHKSINNSPFKRPYKVQTSKMEQMQKEFDEKKVSKLDKKIPNKRKKGYIRRKGNEKAFYAKKQWYRTKADLNKAKSRNQAKHERLVCISERNDEKIIRMFKTKYALAEALIDESPNKFAFTSKTAYKKFIKAQEEKFPQHLKKSIVNTKTTLDDGTVIKANRLQRRHTEHLPKHVQSNRHTQQKILTYKEWKQSFLNIDKQEFYKINTRFIGKNSISKRKSKRNRKRNKGISFNRAKKLNLVQGTFRKIKKVA